MTYRQPFTVFPRKLKSGKKVYYYHTYDSLGKRTAARSTGKSNKSEALKYCMDLYSKQALIPAENKGFIEFTRKWFIYEECPYIKTRKARGYSFSKSYADQLRRNLIKHIQPYFSKSKIDSIQVWQIEDWIMILKQKDLSHTTINHLIKTFRIILNEAERTGFIKNNPMDKVKPLIASSKEKGVLKSSEVDALFSSSAIQTIWHKNKVHYLINLIAANTGMRLGEIQALSKSSLKDSCLLVSQSWERAYGLKSTKSNVNRIIPISKKLETLIRGYINELDSDFLFCNSKTGLPVTHKTIYYWFGKALHNIGISEIERKERNLTFHSWRHYFNSRLRAAGIPDSVTQQLIGHMNMQMTEHYTHFEIEDLNMITEIQNRMIN